MASRKQHVLLYGKKGVIDRVVHCQEANTELVMETGYVEYLGRTIPVWRPINPCGIGVRTSLFEDGKWVSMYQHKYRLHEHAFEIKGYTVTLPVERYEMTSDLRRFLHQHVPHGSS